MLYLSGKTSIMNPQVCVNCFNEKAVNSTTNRLVTESCGHVKCMDCLINEKSGCIACLKEKTVQEHERIPVEDSSLPLHEDTEVVSTNTKELIEPQAPELDLDLESGDDIEEVKRFKPDTSHIKIEIGKLTKFIRNFIQIFIFRLISIAEFMRSCLWRSSSGWISIINYFE